MNVELSAILILLIILFSLIITLCCVIYSTIVNSIIYKTLSSDIKIIDNIKDLIDSSLKN